ncbi:MAG: hypothetical protein KatS3mg115_2636 [Candidatus Poribacteria bacterium]|nr:MAG: hypothetical protein KatS3mg115_2636 [Candidatus Poribacteria bacterium]
MVSNNPASRAERAAELLRRELSDVLQRRAKDPRLNDVVVTRVQMSSDLRVAKVWLSVYPPEEIPEVKKALEKAKGFLRREVAGRMDLRRAPELRFEFDRGAEYAVRMEQLLRAVPKAPTEPKETPWQTTDEEGFFLLDERDEEE